MSIKSQIDCAEAQIKELELQLSQLRQDLVAEQVSGRTLLPLELSREEEWNLLSSKMHVAQERAGKKPNRCHLKLEILQDLYDISEVEDLTRYTQGELTQLKHIGKSTVSNIAAALPMLGLQLRPIGPNRPINYDGRGFKH